MADVVSMDTLVSQYKASISGPVNTLQARKSTLNSRLSALNDLRAKLSTLQTTVRNFALSGTNSPFLKYMVDSSDSKTATATATSLAATGSHTLLVNRLASNDELLSDKLTTATDSRLNLNQTHSFSVTLADGTSRTVNVTLTSSLNGDVMSAIAAAVNADSVLKDKVTASAVTVSSTESRLVLTADGSGASHAITNVGGDFQNMLGFRTFNFSTRAASSSTAAGYVVGGTTDMLNSSFTLDGIAMTRESNAVNDAVSGITFSLKAIQASGSSALNMQVAVDKDSLVKSIQQFITDYNSVMAYIQSKTAVDASSQTRGILSSDSEARMLRSSLRAIAGGVVGGVVAGNPQALADLGITTNRDGSLTLSNTTTLESAITTNVHKVADLFSNSAGNGVAQQMKESLDALLGSGGSLESTTSGIRTQMDSIGDRIKKLNAQIDKRADAYRDQFAQIQVLIAQSQRQQQMINAFL